MFEEIVELPNEDGFVITRQILSEMQKFGSRAIAHVCQFESHQNLRR